MHQSATSTDVLNGHKVKKAFYIYYHRCGKTWTHFLSKILVRLNKKSELLFAMSKLRYTIEIRNRYTENIKMRK